MREQRLDVLIEVRAVHGVDLRRDPQGEAGAHGDLDGPVHPLLRGDAAEEGQVGPRLWPEGVEVRGEAVVDGALPVRPQQRPALVLGYGDDRHLREGAHQRLELRQVQPAVEGGHVGHLDVAHDREVEVVGVEVDDVEGPGLLRHPVYKPHVVGQRVAAPRIRAQGVRHDGDELRGGSGVSAGEEGDLVALADQLLGQVGDDALRAAVGPRGDALVQGGYLCDLH